MTTVRIVLIGPESSGKTTLCKQLSLHFNVSWVPEFAREYLETKESNTYELADLERIAKGQLDSIIKAEQKAPRILFCDTDLVTIHIWSLDKFDRTIEFVEDNMAAQKAELYLLCKPDLAWEYDELREDSTRREELFDWNTWVLKSLEANVITLSGHGEKRLQNAIAAVEGFLEAYRRK